MPRHLSKQNETTLPGAESKREMLGPHTLETAAARNRKMLFVLAGTENIFKDMSTYQWLLVTRCKVRRADQACDEVIAIMESMCNPPKH